jgi:hypothetical protein
VFFNRTSVRLRTTKNKKLPLAREQQQESVMKKIPSYP